MARRWQQISLEEARGHPLYGVKNWLAAFALGVLSIPLREYGTLNGIAHDAGLSLAQLLAADQRYGRFVVGILGLDLLLAAVILWSLYVKDRSFRVTATWLLLGYWPSAALIAVVTRAFEVPGVVGGMTFQFGASSIVLAVWVAYLYRSRRVRVTFENCVVATELPASENQESHLGKGASAPTPAREVMTAEGTADLKLDSGPSEEFWSKASAELESTSRRPGLWARVFSEAQGNESLAKANYLRYRALELQQPHDAQFEQGRRDVEEAARVATIAQQAAKEHADAAIPKGICPNCNAVVPLGVKRCPVCPAVFGPQSAWTLRPIMASVDGNAAPPGRIAAVPGDVPPWVTRFMLVMAGVAVFGIVAAVALPAFQDYTRRQASPNQAGRAPAAEGPWSEYAPVVEANLGQRSGQSGAYSSKDVPVEQAAPSVAPSQRPAGSQPLIDPEVVSVKRTKAPTPAPVMRESERERAYRTQVETDVKAVSERALRDFPYLDTPAGKEVLDKIIARRDELIGQGVYPSIALTRAVNDFAPAYAPVAAKDVPETKTTDTGRPASHNSFPAGCRWVTPQEWSCK